MSLDIALAQWRLSIDRVEAVRIANAHATACVDIDFGGGHRGTFLDDPDAAETRRFLRGVPIPALAVNHANDLGIHTGAEAMNPLCLDVAVRALAVAAELAIPTLHIPSFRRSRISCPEQLRATADFLRIVADDAARLGIHLASESDLGVGGLDALHALVDRPNVSFVVDIGNLVDAGIPVDDVLRLLISREALYPRIHVKAPLTETNSPASILREQVLPYFRPTAVLLENDYSAHRSLILEDRTMLEDVLDSNPLDRTIS